MISERTIHTLELNKIQAMLRGYAVSDLGKAAVDALSPAASLPEAERLLQETMEAESVFWRLGHTPIDVFPDIRASLRRMSAVLALSMGELLGAERCLKVSRRAREAILGGKEQGGDGLLCLLANRLTAQPSIENEIARCILSEEEMADSASPELARIRRQMKITTEKVRDKLNSIIRSAGDQKYLQDSIITMRNGRYTIPVKAEHRRQIPGLIHDQSGTGQTLFIEPAAVVELGNEYKKLLLDEQKEIERILAGLTALLQPYADELYDSLLLLGRLDCIFAKAVKEFREPVFQLIEEIRIKPPHVHRDKRIRIQRTHAVPRHNAGASVGPDDVLRLIDSRQLTVLNLENSSRHAAVVGKRVAENKGRHRHVVLTVLHGFSAHQRVMQNPESVLSVVIVRVDDRERLMDLILRGKQGLTGPPRLHPSLRNAVSRGQILDLLIRVRYLGHLFDPVSDPFPEVRVKIPADDEHDPVEPGLKSVMDGVIHHDFSTGPERFHLLNAASVAAPDACCHHDKGCLLHLFIPFPGGIPASRLYPLLS